MINEFSYAPYLSSGDLDGISGLIEFLQYKLTMNESINWTFVEHATKGQDSFFNQEDYNFLITTLRQLNNPDDVIERYVSQLKFSILKGNFIKNKETGEYLKRIDQIRIFLSKVRKGLWTAPAGWIS